ncbi:MAG: hypothetical protein AVDCRST_MAG67-3725, partial [uncultured Solirubrobacteraceae bacterium]
SRRRRRSPLPASSRRCRTSLPPSSRRHPSPDRPRRPSPPLQRPRRPASGRGGSACASRRAS